MGAVTQKSKLRWAEAYPWLGTDPVSTEPYISASIYEQEIEKVFKRVWLYAPDVIIVRNVPVPDHGRHP